LAAGLCPDPLRELIIIIIIIIIILFAQ